jgi:cytochrome P450
MIGRGASSFNLERQRKPNASFGYGRHFRCGHALNLAIGRLSLGETFRHFKNPRLNTQLPVITKGWRFRGVMNLPVVWDA